MGNSIKFYRVDGLDSTTTLDNIKTLFGVENFPTVSQSEYDGVLAFCEDKEWGDWANTWTRWKENGTIQVSL